MMLLNRPMCVYSDVNLPLCVYLHLCMRLFSGVIENSVGVPGIVCICALHSVWPCTICSQTSSELLPSCIQWGEGANIHKQLVPHVLIREWLTGRTSSLRCSGLDYTSSRLLTLPGMAGLSDFFCTAATAATNLPNKQTKIPRYQHSTFTFYILERRFWKARSFVLIGG